MMRTLTTLSILSLVLAACEGEVGPAGPAGAEGPTGADGADGTDGADGLCASATPLEITGITGVPEQPVTANFPSEDITVTTNGSNVQLSFIGYGAEFESDGDSFTVTPRSEGVQTYTVVATDGCTTAVSDFTIEAFFGSAELNIVNLFEPAGIVDLQRPDGMDDFVNIGFQTQTGYFTIDAQLVEYTVAENDQSFGTTGELALMDEGSYTLVVYADANGDMMTELFEDDTSDPGDDSVGVTVTHYASAAGQVDILDDGAALISDLDYGMTVGPLSLDAVEYDLGIDVDDDGTADVTYDTLDLGDFEGDNLHLYAYNLAGYTLLFASVPDDAFAAGRLLPQLTPSTSISGTESPDLAIPDDGWDDDVGIASSVVFTESCTVLDLSVDLDITHTWRSDLRVFLSAPDGQQITLFSNVGGSNDDLVGTFDPDDDDDSTTVTAGTDADLPEETSLNAFFLANGTGAWTLSVFDDAGGDTGTLNSWGLTLNCL